ncbi:sigma D regulator [Pseudidiomarina taiwanensis]|uniref:Sigma D regulator n=1 Tax=Pseudidiomarina taiwanensis TaxID=337250 RepID=A0A432ZFZ3_9GAMM|nr:sigma D regulator [Pseudidiomarina taiwanensis]RUO76829.1 sigma D regulator [Pseudidiomarina taiwanensis]
MLKRQQAAQQRWQGQNAAIDRWLDERQQLLVKYCQLVVTGHQERDATPLPDAQLIREFCEIMVDYISAGHFEIYDQIIQHSHRAPAITRQVADDVFPLISDTTEIALDFNDAYSEATDQQQLPNFDRDLAELGEALELRMEFEDRLLATLEEHDLMS